MNENTDVTIPPFSLVSGGLLFSLFRRTHLSGDALELLPRRMLAISCIAWLPLLLLSAFEGHALNGALKIPFLYDIEAHIRFLIALPILIAGEVIVYVHIWPALQQILTRHIVPEEDLPRLRSAIESALRIRNSAAVEVFLLILVCTAGHWMWRNQVALGDATWYASFQRANLKLTSAGYWYVFVSIPIFQFILARWYVRLFIWFQLLWRISRLNLQLDAAHPDRAGGLNFLGKTSYWFAPVLFAQGAVLSGIIADRVIFQGQSLMGFKVTAVSLAFFWVFALLGPLFMFAPRLWRTKRDGQRQYGLLASQYLAAFRTRWIQGLAPKSEELLGSADIQSLADMENSYDAVRQMRLVPFGWQEVAVLAGVTMAPLLPLALTVFSVDQLVSHLFKVIF